MIRTVNTDQQAILDDIKTLYCPGGFHADVTYGKGNFYKEKPRPPLCMDNAPQFDFVVEMDCRRITFGSESIHSIVFDPPFIPTGKTYKGQGIMHQRFSSYKGMNALWEFYYKALGEFWRVLTPNGIVVVKCQDTVNDHRNYFSHVYLMNMAEQLRFRCEDLFVLVASNRMTRKNQVKQEHARKFHSYFLVLRKAKSKINHLEAIR